MLAAYSTGVSWPKLLSQATVWTNRVVIHPPGLAGNAFYSTSPHKFSKAINNVRLAIDGQNKGRDAQISDDEPSSIHGLKSRLTRPAQTVDTTSSRVSSAL
jgi:hypothetical protein